MLEISQTYQKPKASFGMELKRKQKQKPRN